MARKVRKKKTGPLRKRMRKELRKRGYPAVSSLEELREWLLAHPNTRFATKLPIFGGSTPRDTDGIWSWDATRILAGEEFTRENLRILPR